MSEEQQEVQAQQQLIKYAEDVAKLYQEVKNENALLKEANRKLEESYIATVVMGFDLIKLYDEYLASHCRRVAYYSEKIAIELKIKGRALTELKLAAFLHDIGLIGIPHDELLEMKHSSLNDKITNDIYLQHPVTEIRPITSTPRFKNIAKIISAHHEYLDGSGFPNGLKGKNIPPESRIITVANEYDTKKRSSKTEIPPEKILSKMEEHLGKKYDIEVFRALSEILKDGDPLSQTIEVSVNELQAGMVLAKALFTIEKAIILGADSVLDYDNICHIKKFYKHDRLKSLVTIYKAVK